jgi:hypothetical protein
MGLFDKLFNDDEKQREEEAKRKAAEKYAEDHAHGQEEHAAAHTATAKKAPAKKAVEPKAAEHKAAEPNAAPKGASAAKPDAAPKAAAKKVPTKSVAAPAVAIPHQHGPSGIPHQGEAKAGSVTVAHDQAMTLHVLAHIPDHAPREDDPHYHLFEQAKARLKRQGLWKCIISDDLCAGEPELHHTFIEFSQINEVDPVKIQQALGLHFENDEQFQEWAESPGNLEVLCAQHHRAHYGIHVIPGPLWEALRFRRAGTAAAAEFVSSAEAKDAD